MNENKNTLIFYSLSTRNYRVLKHGVPTINQGQEESKILSGE